MEKRKNLLVVQQVGDNEMAISVHCNKDELLTGLARIYLTVGAEEAKTKHGNNQPSIQTILDEAKDVMCETVHYIAKESVTAEKLQLFDFN